MPWINAFASGVDQVTQGLTTGRPLELLRESAWRPGECPGCAGGLLLEETAGVFFPNV